MNRCNKSHVCELLLLFFCTEFQCECDYNINHQSGYTANEITGICDTEQCDDPRVFCLNGGECQNRGDSSWCHCPEGTTGVNCESGRQLVSLSGGNHRRQLRVR